MNDSETSAEEEMEIESFSDMESEEDVDENYESYVERMAREEQEQKNLTDVDDVGAPAKTLQAGNWVLVSFPTKKKKVYYVGQIIKFAESKEPVITFLKKTSNTHSTFTWPEKPDESEVLSSDIEIVLPEPQLGRRGVLIFPVSFNSYDVK